MPVDPGRCRREGPGSTGMGLQIAWRTVAAIGGTMDIQSGAGTTVNVDVSRAAHHATA